MSFIVPLLDIFKWCRWNMMLLRKLFTAWNLEFCLGTVTSPLSVGNEQNLQITRYKILFAHTLRENKMTEADHKSFLSIVLIWKCRMASVVSKMGFLFLEQGFPKLLVPICIIISVCSSGTGFYYQVFWRPLS